jgi:hypothetical protein
MSVLGTLQVNVVHLCSDIYVLWHLLRLFLAIMLPLTMSLGGFLFAAPAPAIHVDKSSAADFRMPIPSINLLQTTLTHFLAARNGCAKLQARSKSNHAIFLYFLQSSTHPKTRTISVDTAASIDFGLGPFESYITHTHLLH